MHTTLLQFAHVSDAVAATSSKLSKQKILAEFFRQLEIEDLRLAVRFSAGRAFPVTDGRVLSVGGAIVTDVVLALLKIDPVALHDLVVRSGEMGEALSTAWPDLPPSAPLQSITLRDLADAFEDLAAAGVQREKREILSRLFAHCTLPREAAYLAKIIFGDLRTGVQEGVLQAAIAQAFEKSLPAVQRCDFLVGDLEEVAVLAKNDALTSARFRLFHPIQFMLATPQADAAEAYATMGGRAFWAEDKLDGIRAQVHMSGNRLAIYTRTMDRVDESFPEVAETLGRLSGDFLLDGEIVPWQDGQVLPFARLQKRLGRKTPSAKMLREHPLLFIAFDILYRDGELLTDYSLRQRRSVLSQLDIPQTQTTDVTTAEQIAAAFEAARSRRNEGIILKDPESVYTAGRRGQMWLKLKTHLPTLDCVVTAAEFGHGKRRNALSDYTFAVWDRDPAEPNAALVNVGKAFSGVSDSEIAQLTELFPTITVQRFGRVFYVEPKVVLEIACDQIQKSARHASGYALRFPRIKRIRWDKRPADADRLARVVELYESAANFARSSGSDAPPPVTEPTLFD